MPLFEVSQRVQKRCARRMKIVGEQNRQHHALKNKCWRCVCLGRLPTNQPGCSSARHARKLACVGSASRRKRVGYSLASTDFSLTPCFRWVLTTLERGPTASAVFCESTSKPLK